MHTIITEASGVEKVSMWCHLVFFSEAIAAWSHIAGYVSSCGTY